MNWEMLLQALQACVGKGEVTTYGKLAEWAVIPGRLDLTV